MDKEGREGGREGEDLLLVAGSFQSLDKFFLSPSSPLIFLLLLLLLPLFLLLLLPLLLLLHLILILILILPFSHTPVRSGRGLGRRWRVRRLWRRRGRRGE